ncbi:Prolamin-like domain [Arabidopsis thaliana x Arabidopsis arenosa]|uniref:Prolamin-like domain n=1 Tax=Arabidopsis thaliana x Arabidopsis arenosa TaxID=1240361 RepID=A0A8T1ZM02_9BRAS|nr:Prolamin-like domain [Arabidopsis thaliana x Arabidopsis arenosa]
MQRMWATIILALIMVLSISIQTHGNEKVNDLACAPSSALAPQSENGVLPKPISCLNDLNKISNCTNAVKHFQIKRVTKSCCIILLSLPDNCFGRIFAMRWIYHTVLTVACKALGYIK